MSTRNTHRGLTVLAAAGALLTVAFATAPPADAATIYACVKKRSGAVRIVSQSAKCKKSELKLSWNTTGRNGANGRSGTNGAQGAAGKEGTRGETGPRGPSTAFNVSSAKISWTFQRPWMKN